MLCYHRVFPDKLWPYQVQETLLVITLLCSSFYLGNHLRTMQQKFPLETSKKNVQCNTFKSVSKMIPLFCLAFVSIKEAKRV